MSIFDGMSEEEIRLLSLDTHEDPLYGKRLRCKECGVRSTLSWNGLKNYQLKQAGLCFDCEFWIRKIDWDVLNVVRVNHHHYHIAEAAPGEYFRGHGGRSFRVYFFDGRVVESQNVWSQGEIPERFWDRLPDNAELVSDLVRWNELMKQYPVIPTTLDDEE